MGVPPVLIHKSSDFPTKGHQGYNQGLLKGASWPQDLPEKKPRFGGEGGTEASAGGVTLGKGGIGTNQGAVVTR